MNVGKAEVLLNAKPLKIDQALRIMKNEAREEVALGLRHPHAQGGNPALTVKSVNPKVKAEDIMPKYCYVYFSMEVELLDLLEWAAKGSISSLGG